MRVLQRLGLAGLTAAVALLVAPGAFACGSGGYSYAGLAANTPAYGISASVTPLAGFDVRAGHVAGWVGVGGPGEGPSGADEWLQAGFSGFPDANGNNVYYELMLPNQPAVYKELRTSVPYGTPARLAVLEIKGRPNWWRVWVDGAPATGPILLPGSHGRWSPIATAESWDGGVGSICNGFLYDFRNVSIATAPGGSWRLLMGGTTIANTTSKVARSSQPGAFLAAQGQAALRTLAVAKP
jgi:hypothetical protein